MNRPLSMAALWAATTLPWAGCGTNQVRDTRGETRALVEIVSWWLAPGEAEALQALISTHSLAHPGARIFNAAAWSASVSGAIIGDRLSHDDPPDLLQLNGRELRDVETRYPGSLERLDGLFDELELRGTVFPEAIDDVTYDGVPLAMPVNMHRENALFYNKAIFAAHHLSPPTTVAEFMAACKALKAAGVTPVATAHQGWILRMMLNALAAGTMGSAAFHDYFLGKSDAGLPRLREAVAIFAEVIEKYSNPDAGEEGFGWTHAAQTIYNGDAAMLFQGDWAKGYLMQLGWRPGVDFGVVGAPGAADLFLYLTDVFAIPRGAKNPRGALDLLVTVASPQGQVAFNRLKGSSPIRGDVGKETLDPLGRATLADLERARFRMPAPNLPAYDDALMRFIADRDTAALVQVFVDNRPNAQRARAN